MVRLIVMKTHSDSFKGGVVESTDETPLPLGVSASSSCIVNIVNFIMMMMMMIYDDDKVGLDGGTWPVGIPLWKVELRTFCISPQKYHQQQP